MSSFLDQKFEEAVEFVRTGASNKPIDNETKLNFYALFKQAIEGDLPTSRSRPSWMQQVERAKFDAWASKRGTSRDDAKREYVKLVFGDGALNAPTPQKAAGLLAAGSAVAIAASATAISHGAVPPSSAASSSFPAAHSAGHAAVHFNTNMGSPLPAPAAPATMPQTLSRTFSVEDAAPAAEDGALSVPGGPAGDGGGYSVMATPAKPSRPSAVISAANPLPIETPRISGELASQLAALRRRSEETESRVAALERVHSEWMQKLDIKMTQQHAELIRSRELILERVHSSMSSPLMIANRAEATQHTSPMSFTKRVILWGGLAIAVAWLLARVSATTTTVRLRHRKR